ncbi:hypothetical protein DSO57_1017216 [Entomophthora muscae]|uniref:Uncharacterized protein n=1 Tax=Entomophthora muscae TaxID=34485 RepID=A0ACC2U2R8_9FUNG|nr:hypothetical protein DSO57_1017216 [Entomophthora muscae]
MVPVSGPWAVLGKLLFNIVKLAPILWWALPAGPAGCPPASSQEPPQVGSLTTASFLSVVSALENPIPTTDWHNSSPDNAHQKESLAHE